MEHAGDNFTNCNWCVWNSNKRFIKGTGGLGSWRTSGDHPNYYIFENGQNTEKSPGDMKRLSVTQTPVKNHLLTLMWKTLMIIIIIMHKALYLRDDINKLYVTRKEERRGFVSIEGCVDPSI